MSRKNPYAISSAGRWLIFAGVPTTIAALFFMIEDRFLDRFISQNVSPYTDAIIPIAIVISCMVLYDRVPRRLVIPFGIAGWTLGLSLLYWYFWFGPGAFGHH